MDTYLINVGDRDIETLIEALDNPIAEERSLASFALVSKGASVVRPLIHALEVDDAAIRLEAARLLGDLRSPIAAAALIKSLDDPDEAVRHMASNSLVQLREGALRPILEHLAAGIAPGRTWDGLLRTLGGLQDYGVLRDNLKRIVEAMRKNSPTMPVPMVAKDLLVHLR